MLKELIHTKVNEIFAEYQKANNITSGDIDPFNTARLEHIEEALAELIERVCHIPDSFYIYRDAEGIAHTATYKGSSTDKFFNDISYKLAFDDCSNEAIVAIFYQGKEVRYAGWQPGMKYEYKDLDGNTVWVRDFPNWDH